MRRLIIFIVILIITSTKGISQSYLFMGIRDNNYAQLGFGYKKYYIKLEQSMFIAKAKSQNLNLHLGYIGNFKNISYEIYAYNGFHYNNYFNTFGGAIDTNTILCDFLEIFLGVRPHYDSTYKYKTCFKSGVGFNLHNDIALIAIFQNYPEYRICDNRITAGLRLKIQNLQVYPYVSIPINNKTENTRVLISFSYKLKFT